MVSSDTDEPLLRKLGWLESFSVIVGTTIGAGIFVITAEGTAIMGPATPLGFALGLPIILATAYIYSVYMSSPLGRHPGGAYVHISRTWDSTFVGFSFMWLKWIGFMGGIAAIAISFGDAIRYWETFRFLGTTGWALLFLTAIWLVQLAGVELFGNLQAALTVLLVGILLLLGVPGLFFIEPSNYDPLFPQTLYSEGYVSPFLQGIATLLFAYLGFESLAQTAGETESPESKLPKVFVYGMLFVGGLYVLVAAVVVGALPWQVVADSKAPLTAAAETYFPVGTAGVVAFGSILAYASTLNSVFMVPSRILYAFGMDGLMPDALVHVNDRFRTPDVSLTLTYLIVAALIVTSTFNLVVALLLSSLFVLYSAHSLSAVALPWVRPELYEQCEISPRPALLAVVGLFSTAMMGLFAWQELSLDGLATAAAELGRGNVVTALTGDPTVMLFGWYVLGVAILFANRIFGSNSADEQELSRLFKRPADSSDD